MSFFNTTLVNGIQDISALLPLLGTEQLEIHVGSALLDGFLYAAVAPISIFGCLGAVRLGITVVIASIVYQFSWVKKNGPRWLSDAGYELCGTVAGLIGLDPSKKIYVAESKLRQMLEEKHIENVDKLTVRPGDDSLLWNTKLAIFSTFFAALSMLPYIYVVRLQEDVTVWPWLYPIMRASGTALVAVFSQIVIQIRILQIVRDRLIFMTIDKRYPRVAEQVRRQGGIWDAQEPSEKCLWHLRRMPRIMDIESQSTTPDILRMEENRQHLHRPADAALTITSAVLILLGSCSSIFGYVGCFSLLQTTSAPAPLVWLGTEAALSLIRIIIWAANPEVDDPSGLSFRLDLSPNVPLVTCNKSDDEICEEKKLPIMTRESFLEEITTFAGPLKTFSPGNVSIYYTLTGRRDPGDPKVLYIAIFGNEQVSGVIVKRSPGMQWEYFELGSAHRGENWVPIGKSIGWEKSPFICDIPFRLGLESHCNHIAARIASELRARNPAERPNQENAEQSRRGSMGEIFAWLGRGGGAGSASKLPHRTSQKARAPENAPEDTLWRLDIPTDWTLELQSRTDTGDPEFPPLSEVDKKYLEHGKKEQEGRRLYQYREWWNAMHMSMVREELEGELPKGRKNVFIGEKLEINEIENLLITECVEMEMILADEFQHNEFALQKSYVEISELIEKEWKKFKVLWNSKESEEKAIVIKRLEEEWTRNGVARMNAARDGSFRRLAGEREMGRVRMTSVNFSLYEDDTKEKWEKKTHEKPLNEKWGPEQEWEAKYTGRAGDLTGSIAHTTTGHLPVESIESRMKKLIATLQSEHEKMDERIDTARSDIIVGEPGEYSAVKRRCLERRVRMEDRLKGEQKLAEHTNPLFGQLKSLRDEEILERMKSMLRLMQSKYTKFLVLSDATKEAVEDADNLAFLIKLNKVAKVVSVTAKLDDQEALVISEAIKSMANVATVFNESHGDGSPRVAEARDFIANKVKGMSSSSSPIITYHHVSVADGDRSNNPYISFHTRIRSYCEVRFTVPSNARNKDLRMNDNRSGTAPLMLTLDGRQFNNSGKTESVTATGKFGWYTFRMFDIPEGEHTLVIRNLGANSRRVSDIDSYHLSDIELVDTDPHDVEQSPNSDAQWNVEWIVEHARGD